MKQPHTEQSVKHTQDQQNTGNHKAPSSQESGGADRFGGTRTGADNVEDINKTSRDSREESIESGTDVDKVSGLDEVHTSTKQVENPKERHPERDEFGRL